MKNEKEIKIKCIHHEYKHFKIKYKNELDIFIFGY
jgi:hypothetical protein